MGWDPLADVLIGIILPRRWIRGGNPPQKKQTHGNSNDNDNNPYSSNIKDYRVLLEGWERGEKQRKQQQRKRKKPGGVQV